MNIAKAVFARRGPSLPDDEIQKLKEFRVGRAPVPLVEIAQMIGIIEKVIVDCLLEVGNEELVQDVFFAAGIPPDRIYRLDQHYPDAETAKLIDAALKVTGITAQQFFDLFSIVFFDVVDDVFPEFLRMCANSEDLVRKQVKIHAIIAAGSRKPGESQKSTDKFHLEDRGPHDILVHYNSELQLSGLYETLVRQAAARYGDEVRVERLEAPPDGEAGSAFSVRWTSLAGQPTHFHEGQDGVGEKQVRHG